MPGVLGRVCLHQLSRAAFSPCSPFAIRPCQRGEFHQGQASFPHPGHNPPTWTWQECFHMDLLHVREGEGTCLCKGTTQNGEVTVGSAPTAGPSAAPRLNSGWSMVQHLPSLCGDSQASQNQSKMIFIWWVQDEGFSPGPEFPSSWWFADSASIIVTALIPTLPTRQLSPCRLHRDVADCKAQSQEYCTGILQIARYNLFFP